jgi:uncharacterized membrane protein
VAKEAALAIGTCTALQGRAMSTTRRVLLWLMGVLYILAGINHFREPGFYLPMMPPYLPWHPALVFLSGVAEVVVGVGVLIPTMRRLSAWGAMALLIAVFPANLHIALNNVPIGGAAEGAGMWNWLRLPLQGVLIVWAWWYTRDAIKRPGERCTDSRLIHQRGAEF